MDFCDKALRFCDHITLLSGVYCTLLDMNTKEFCKPSFHRDCMLQGTRCQVCEHMENWKDKQLYCCPSGYMYFVAQLRSATKEYNYRMITGPFLISQYSGQLEIQGRAGVPILTRAQADALSEAMHAICYYLRETVLLRQSDTRIQEETLQTLAVYAGASSTKEKYPIDDERLLQQMIREGRRQEAQQLLNAMLIELYSGKGLDLAALKKRMRDLLTLMSRAAADSGANVEAVLELCDQAADEIDAASDIDILDQRLAKALHQFFDMAFDFGELKHRHTIRQLSIYLQEHLGEHLTLDECAAKVFMSKSYLCRVLKTELGCTFTEYVNRLRVERSKVYLANSNLSICEIASLVGFDDQSYYTRVFRRIEGVPPGRFRAGNAVSHSMRASDVV